MTARTRRNGRSTYRVLNWPEYNRGLKRRGDIRLWLSEDVIEDWYCGDADIRSGRGRPFLYSDMMIECALSLRCIFHLGLRQTQGFVESLLGMMNISVSCACYTTLSRRFRGVMLIAK